MIDIAFIYNYIKGMSTKLVKVANEEGDPWIFLMCSCFIDYLVRMVNDKETIHKDYKDFIRSYLSRINPLYRDFKFSCGKQDLPEQMYHVLRSGIVHSFSLVPDSKSLTKGGRSRSIIVSHRKNNNVHMTPYMNGSFDSVIFTAEDFAEDLDKLVDLFFNDIALKDDSLKNNITQWFTKHPHIMAMSELQKHSLL
ncbi:MAG: hypothetical protein KBG02_11370 [Haliscomenobacter sp.]|nr:hypothetical protein [Haliscomenobacter sp.]